MYTSETNDLLAETNDLLAEQNDLLRQMLAAVSGQQKLGFGVSSRPTYVYCNRQYGSLWYTLDYSADPNGRPVAIPQSSLTGYLRGLSFRAREYKGEQKHKLNLTVQADQVYILESSYDSVFAKTLMLSLAALDPSMLANPLTIQVDPADQEEKVLFCKILLPDGSSVQTENEDPLNTYKGDRLRALAAAALAVFKGA